MHELKELALLVEEFIRKAPSFEGDEELAKKIGKAMADLYNVVFE
jgi:hypothetical protein